MRLRGGKRTFQDGGMNLPPVYQGGGPMPAGGQSAFVGGGSYQPAPGAYQPPPGSGVTFPQAGGGSFTVDRGVTTGNAVPPGMTNTPAAPGGRAPGAAGTVSPLPPGASFQGMGGAPGGMSPQQQAAMQAWMGVQGQGSNMQRPMRPGPPPAGGPPGGAMGPMAGGPRPPGPPPGAGGMPGAGMPPGGAGMQQLMAARGPMPPGGMQPGAPPPAMPGGPPGGGGGMMGPMQAGGGSFTPMQNMLRMGALAPAAMPPPGAPQPTSATTGFNQANQFQPGIGPQGYAPPNFTPQQAAGMAGIGINPATGLAPGMAKGGKVRTFDSTKAASGNLATHPGKGKFAKGGVLKKKPPSAKKAKKVEAPQPPPDDDDLNPAPGMGGPLAAPAAMAPPAPAGPPVAPPGMAEGGEVHGKNCKCSDCAKRIGGAIKKAKGGECDKMAAGGAAKVRRGFPNTIKAPGKTKGYAKGGSVRGGGAAQRGLNFSGIY